MKNQSCPKNDCMYLHELGDDLASFTKEQMQQVKSSTTTKSSFFFQSTILFQGKHTEYEKALHEEMLAGLAGSPPSPIEGSSEGGGEDGGTEWRYRVLPPFSMISETVTCQSEPRGVPSSTG